MDVPTLQECKDAYKDVFFLEDDTILDLILAVAINTMTDSDPIWLLIIGGSSAGKSELINTLSTIKKPDGKPMSYDVSTLTTNTLLSAMATSDGKEKSLLHRIGKKGLMLMKDYTSILSKKQDQREDIVSQLREVYDGKFTKETGGKTIQPWKGKINWIGAVTDTIHVKEGESAGMGRRTINYVLPEPTAEGRISTTKKASRNTHDSNTKRDKIQKYFEAYVLDKITNIPSQFDDIPEDFSDELITLSDFSTHTRTPVERNFKGELKLVMSLEMPMRMSQQLHLLAQTFQYMNNGVLTENHKNILFKVALDSIPKQRRLALKELARYRAIVTKGLAQITGYPTTEIKNWVEDLNALRVVTRFAEGLTGVDKWILKDSFKQIMIKYDNITPVDIDLMGDESIKDDTGEPNFYKKDYDIGSYDPGFQVERKQIEKAEFDNFASELRGTLLTEAKPSTKVDGEDSSRPDSQSQKQSPQQPPQEEMPF